MEYVKKPVTYEAVKWDGSNYPEVSLLVSRIEAAYSCEPYQTGGSVVISVWDKKASTYRDVYLGIDEYVVLSSKGKLTVMDSGDFEKTFEAVGH